MYFKFCSLLCLIFLLGCQSNQPPEEKQEALSDSAKSLEALEYYKCDYSKKDSLIVILSSGSENETNETWAIDPDDIVNFDTFQLDDIHLDKLVLKGKNHLSNRFDLIDLSLDHFTLQRIEQNRFDSNNWVCLITFSYDGKAQFQMVPLLLDGSIVLSDKE